MGLKTISDILAGTKDTEEVYLTDAQARKKRSQKGIYRNSGSSFSFLHLVKEWHLIVGKMLSENTIPLRIKNSTLFILTKHSIFSQELGLMSPQIIARIEEHFPKFKDQVKKIRFQNGDFTAQEFNQIQNKHKKNEPEVPKHHRFDPKFQKRQQEVSQMFNDVEDDDIKELLERICLNNLND